MNLKNLLDKNPIQISGVVMLLVNFLVVAGVIDVSAETVASGNAALIGLLGLFVTTRTTNTAKLEEFAKN